MQYPARAQLGVASKLCSARPPPRTHRKPTRKPPSSRSTAPAPRSANNHNHLTPQLDEVARERRAREAQQATRTMFASQVQELAERRRREAVAAERERALARQQLAEEAAAERERLEQVRALGGAGQGGAGRGKATPQTLTALNPRNP